MEAAVRRQWRLSAKRSWGEMVLANQLGFSYAAWSYEQRMWTYLFLEVWNE